MMTTIWRRALGVAGGVLSCGTGANRCAGVGSSRALRELYEEESWEAGVRLARAAKAREEGHEDVAALMEEVALDEARHLSLVVRLLHPDEVERDLATNLRAMIEGDRGAAEREQQRATIARRAGMDREAALFEVLARDELAHIAKLEAALRQLNSPDRVGDAHVTKR